MDPDQIEELSPEDDAAADAAFEAAFNTARGDAAPDVGTTIETGSDGQPLITDVEKPELTDEEKAAQAQAEADAAAAAQAEADANAPVAITKAELDALRAVSGQLVALQDELRRSTDKVNGRFGSLQQTVEAVKLQAAQGVKPTLGQLKRLEADFPEMAQMLREDLEDAFGAGNATQAPAPATNGQQDDGKASGDAPGANPEPQAPADPLADPRVQQVLKAKEMAIVDAVHPDWRDLAKTTEFNEWKATLHADDRHLLGTTWNSEVLKGAFSDFKGWQQKRTAAAEANKQRGKRLENGIPATTGNPTGAHAIDDDAAFAEGFNKIRKGRL